jgi:nitrogen fixation NifU-like protein
MSSLYTEIIQDAYKHPAHRGEIPEHTHAWDDENPLCGDTLHIELLVEGETIRDARFTGRGCAISQASAELMLDRMIGQPLESVASLNREDVLEELGIPSISPARLKCALLSIEVMKRAAVAGSTE